MNIVKTDNEKELLLKISRGDEQAFSEIFDLYRNKIWTVAWKLTDSPELAEEIVQDVFMKIWMKRADLPIIRDFDSFLFIIARNRSFSCLKKIARGEVLMDEPEKFAPIDPATPENILMEREFLALLQEAIDSLPEQQRKVWKLVKEEGMSRQEAADHLGISVNTLKEHLKRAMFSVRAYSQSRMDPGALLALIILFYC